MREQYRGLISEVKSSNLELCSVLNQLILSWESEVVEFKEAGKNYDKNRIGQYFSAISNEANLKGLQHGWLVFGVRNQDRKVIGSDYRNQLLAETMVKLNMIDSQATGIRRVFRIQKERYFPLPDYDFLNRQQVKVCIYGKILDENYSQILFNNPNFDLETVFLINCIQKGVEIDKDALKYLRKLNVIEGKMPNVFLSATISETLGEKDRYVKNKAFDDQYYRDLVVKYLEKYGSAKKKDIQMLLWDKLPSIMEDKQKKDKIRNLLTSMRKKEIIKTDSENQQRSSWILVDKIKQEKQSFKQE